MNKFSLLASLRLTVPAMVLLATLPPPARAATGTLKDVQHVVVFIQENRSFDHYFGTLNGVRGFEDRTALLMQNGDTVLLQPQNNSYVLPFHTAEQCLTDVDHSETTDYAAWNLGRWDRWVLTKGTTTMSYYTRGDLPLYYTLADAYTVCDGFYCSVMGPTYPNRLYLLTGMIDPNGTGGGPAVDNTVPVGGFTWTTYPERLQNAGVNWKVYQQSTDSGALNVLALFAQYRAATPGNPLYDRGMALVTNLVAAFQTDVTNGTLPRVSWIITPWSASEHPPFSPVSGAALTKQLLDALASNPSVFNSTVFIHTYDENGGFFDHLPSPVPPPGTTNEFVNGLPIGLGIRIPVILVSPWTRGGYVCSQTFDHTSILRFLEQWTGVMEPNISSWRRQVCGDLTSAFNFANPDTSYPVLPTVAPVTCPTNTPPTVPSPQTLPLQEPGNRPARFLPYQPNAVAAADCLNWRVCITMTNAGNASVHFAIYPNAFRTDGPWPFDVAPSNAVTACFNLLTNGGLYDFTCYGPNGFLRRFTGNLSTNCGAYEVTPALDLDAGGVVLGMRNLSASAAAFTISNAYPDGGPWNHTLPAGQNSTQYFPAVTNNLGWYDLTVTVGGDALFQRRTAGHLETGPPRLVAAIASGTLWLSFPLWAASYSLESAASLSAPVWSVLSVPQNVVSNRVVVTLPLGNGPQFFRLRK